MSSPFQPQISSSPLIKNKQRTQQLISTPSKALLTKRSGTSSNLLEASPNSSTIDVSSSFTRSSSKSSIEGISHVLPFHHSYAYTIGPRATPASSVPENLRSYHFTSRFTGGTEYLNYGASEACTKVDQYLREELAPRFESVRSQHLLENRPLDQTTLLASMIEKVFDTESERVRAIFKWICIHIKYDERLLNPIENIQLHSLHQTKSFHEVHDPDEVMEKRVSTSEGYANLFVLLCKKLDIQAASIKGFAKGFSSGLGDKLDEYNHIWNSVQLNGKWYLLDICWCRGYVEFGRFKESFTNAYFMANPKTFAMEHYPINDRWMLFDPRLSKDVFERAAKISAFAVSLGACPVMKEHVNGVISTDKSFLIMPFYTETPVQVHVKVTPLISNDKYDKKNYVFGSRFHHVQHFLNGGFRLMLLFPYAGTYNVLIFATERREPADTTDQMVIGDDIDSTSKARSKTFRMIFEYLVEAGEGLLHDVGFVDQTHILSSKGGRIEAPIQEYLIRSSAYHFRIRVSGYVMVMVKIGEKVGTYLSSKSDDPDLFQGDVVIEPDLKEFHEGMYISVNGFDEMEGKWVTLALYMVYSILPELDQVKLPFLDLSLLLKKRRAEAPREEMTLQMKQNSNEELFQIFSPVVKNENIHIVPLSHQHILISSGSGCYTIAIECKNRNVKFKPLPLEQYGCCLEHQTTWMVCPRASIYYFRVECPVPGVYVFKVSAKVKDPNQDETTVIALRYIIDCSSWSLKTIESSDISRTKRLRLLTCYPKPYPSFFTLGCVLLSPTQVIITQRSYHFRIYVPNVENVGVVCNGIWNPLKRLHSEDSNTLDLNHTFESDIMIPSGFQTSFECAPSVYICTGDLRTKALNVHILCRFKVYRSGNESTRNNVLSDYDEKTVVDPSPEMLKHIRIVSHKRKMIIVDDDTSHSSKHEMCIQFRRIKFDNKYLYKDRYQMDSLKYNPFLEGERDSIINSLPGQFRDALTSNHSSTWSDGYSVDSFTVFMKARLFDAVEEVQRAVLVEQDNTNLFDEQMYNLDKGGSTAGYYQIRVLLPKPGRYYLKISLVIIDQYLESREEHDGVSYWIHFNEGNVKKEEDLTVSPETEHDRDTVLASFMFGKDRFEKAEKYFRMQKDLHGNNGIDGSPVFIPFRKQHVLQSMYHSFVNRNRPSDCGFVFVSPENCEWFRPMIYEPCMRTLVIGCSYRVKIKVHNTDSVSMCCAVRQSAKRMMARGMSRTNIQLPEKQDKFTFSWEKNERAAMNQVDYEEWQQLDNSSAKVEWEEDKSVLENKNTPFNTIHGDNIWEGVVSFSKGSEVHVMARYGPDHYVSVATWSLKHASVINDKEI